MPDINATLPFLGPVSSTIQQIFSVVSILVGGIFGIYVITLIVRLFFFRKIYKSFEEIKISIKRLEAKVDNLGKKKK
ncbi:hypothetical protein JYT91_01500 [archaeon AH-315-M20]|nr:hypothetical protein [archaeon AH-315-M20]